MTMWYEIRFCVVGAKKKGESRERGPSRRAIIFISIKKKKMDGLCGVFAGALLPSPRDYRVLRRFFCCGVNIYCIGVHKENEKKKKFARNICIYKYMVAFKLARVYCINVVGRLALNMERRLLCTSGTFRTCGKLSFPPCIWMAWDRRQSASFTIVVLII